MEATAEVRVSAELLTTVTKPIVGRVTGPAPWGEALGQKLFPGEGLYAARGDIEPLAGNPPARPDQGDPG